MRFQTGHRVILGSVIPILQVADGEGKAGEVGSKEVLG